MEYIRTLASSGREKETPRYLIVSDFRRIAIHDLEPEQDPDLPLLSRLPPSFEFPLQDFHKHIRHFFFIAGYKQHRLNPEDPANEEATQLMCDLYDALETGEYGTDDAGRAGHELKQFLVRLLFCLFAEDNGIFPTKSFQFYLQDHTAPDGSDLGPKLHELFEVLNTPENRRQKNLAADLAQFPYINGDLYRERLALPAFTSAMRAKLLACGTFDWSRISPAVFGSLFQAVMEPKARRQVGAHYTAERNILKVVHSLFLDDLRAEFTAIKSDRSGRRRGRLAELQKKLAALRFLDPACGCGNFLVITYRELRALELDLLTALHGDQQEMTLDDVNKLSLLDVDQMFGIEIEEFPARIAEVALWLADHQANVALGLAFTQAYLRIPLRKSPHIHVANALRKPWSEVLPPAECSYILGNPPFVGKKEQSVEQKADMDAVLGDVKVTGVLDFVTCWYRKAADYITAPAMQRSGNEIVPRAVAVPPVAHAPSRAVSGALAGNIETTPGTAADPMLGASRVGDGSSAGARTTAREGACATGEIRVAFVSTNSICQGEQVSVLWGFLLSRYRVKLHFAHRTFPWESEARACFAASHDFAESALTTGPSDGLVTAHSCSVTSSSFGPKPKSRTPLPSFSLVRRNICARYPACSLSTSQNGDEPAARRGAEPPGRAESDFREPAGAGRLPGASAACGICGEGLPAVLRESHQGRFIRGSATPRSSLPAYSRLRPLCRARTHLPEPARSRNSCKRRGG